MPYQPTWQNPYVPQGSTAPLGQSFTLPYQPQPINGIIQVNGRDSALQYQLPPNSMSPALFDKSGTCFYVVSTDGTGMKTVETFDFMPHVEEQPVQEDERRVTRQEFDELVDKVNQMIGANNGVHAAVPAATAAAQPAVPQQAVNLQADRTGQPQRIDATARQF